MTSQESPDVNSQANQLLGDVRLNAALLESLPFRALLVNKSRVVLAANGLAREMGTQVGTHCWDTFGQRASTSEQDRQYFEAHGAMPPAGIRCHFCLADKALQGQSPQHLELPVGEAVYDTWWVPLGADVYLHYAVDVTDVKKSSRRGGR